MTHVISFSSESAGSPSDGHKNGKYPITLTGDVGGNNASGPPNKVSLVVTSEHLDLI